MRVAAPAEERVAERRLADLRGRVKAARAVISGAPGLAETLTSDWRRAARFYARFGVTEELVRNRIAVTDLLAKAEAEGSRWVDTC